MIGTVRTLDADMKALIIRRMTEMTEGLAKTYGGSATIEFENKTAITYNDIKLTEEMLPTLQKVAGNEHVKLIKAITGGEDFSFFQEKVPGFFFFLGGMTPDITTPFPHHTPDFSIDESGLILGVKVLTEMSLDFLNR